MPCHNINICAYLEICASAFCLIFLSNLRTSVFKSLQTLVGKLIIHLGCHGEYKTIRIGSIEENKWLIINDLHVQYELRLFIGSDVDDS